ncbi:glycoside hydrolase family 31 protein [Candidatus Fermentibacteria bacterium]|nr:glycoside hydrolase family 31 protein [Candidatus Fermentibacteria bacterium]
MRLLTLLCGALLCGSASGTSGSYTFLGEVHHVDAKDAGVALTCDHGITLQISFLDAQVVRVTLTRPGDERPLGHAIAEIPWPRPHEIETHEESLLIEIRSPDLAVNVRKRPCRISIRDRHTGAILAEDDPGMGIGWDGAEVRNWKTIAPHERFFGLGEKTGPLDVRGRELVLWNTDNPHHDNNSDPLYQSIPFFIGLRDGHAFGTFFNNSYRSRFNFGAGNLRYYSFAAEGGVLDYFFINGPRVSEVVRRYTDLTGRTPMPPMWALGYQQCRWSYYPDTEVLRIARTFREKGIPADVIYLDIHYMDDYRVFTWHPEHFPKPKELLKTLGTMGFKVAVIIDPGIKVDTEYPVALQGLAGDHFVKYPDGQLYVGEVWPGPSYFPDFSRPATRVWWGSLFKGLVDLGVRGFWNDMNEPAVWGQAFPNEAVFDDEGRGATGKKMHNLYGFLMAQATYDGVRTLQPALRPLVITRAGFAGEQRFTSVWTGDNQATWQHLEMGVRMLQGMGLSGLPFVGTDVGGFSGTPSPELFARWVQFGAVSPFFRAHTHHGSGDQEPWSFGEEVEEIAKETITRRYAMLPYFYSLFWEAHTTGAPLLRPLFWHHQDDPLVYDPATHTQFLLGEHLLVAPVVREGHDTRRVYLPEGMWLDLATEMVHHGPGTIMVDAPLARVPVFLGDGGILVSQEPMQFVGELKPRLLKIDAFPADEPSAFILYEDDGETWSYERGVYRTTTISCERDGDSVQLDLRPCHETYDPGPKAIEVKIHACPKPARVLDSESILAQDAAFRGWRWDEATRILTISVMDHRVSHSLTAELAPIE